MPPASASFPFDTLVFSGGAMEVAAFIGCLRRLEEQGEEPSSPPLAGVTTVAGTSAGAIMALCLALGMRSAELRRWLTVRTLECEVCRVDVDAIIQLFDTLGIDDGSGLVRFLGDMLEERLGGARDVTFGELRRRLPARRLVVCAADIECATPVYFHAEATPDVSVVDAVRASACVPFLYAPVRIGGRTYVDGGLFENLPLGFLPSKAKAEEGEGRSRCLALRLPWSPPPPPTDMSTYAWCLASSLLRRTNALCDACPPAGVTVLDVAEEKQKEEREGIATFCSRSLRFCVDQKRLQGKLDMGYRVMCAFLHSRVS